MNLCFWALLSSSGVWNCPHPFGACFPANNQPVASPNDRHALQPVRWFDLVDNAEARKWSSDALLESKQSEKCILPRAVPDVFKWKHTFAIKCVSFKHTYLVKVSAQQVRELDKTTLSRGWGKCRTHWSGLHIFFAFIPCFILVFSFASPLLTHRKHTCVFLKTSYFPEMCHTH